jgi:LmbE family N-acetylglucosaminyl deacetylase
MTRAVFFVPHPDDDLYSMWPALHLLASGYEVHFVYLTRGEVTPASLKLDPDPSHYTPAGQPTCNWGDHAYRHSPDLEQFTLPTSEELGLSRLNEGKSCIGAMATIPPTVAGAPGHAFWHDENLGTAYGCDGCGSSTAPPTEGGIAKADAVIRKYVDLYPNSFFYSMSPTDDHPDHAACGIALRRLKGNPVYHSDTKTFTYTGGDPVLGPLLANAMFFVSKLYWGGPGGTPPRPADVLAEKCAWYPNEYPDNSKALPRIDEYTAHLKTKVAKAYTSWNPAQGSFAIGGGHSTPSQMANCILSPSVVSALWHP